MATRAPKGASRPTGASPRSSGASGRPRSGGPGSPGRGPGGSRGGSARASAGRGGAGGGTRNGAARGGSARRGSTPKYRGRSVYTEPGRASANRGLVGGMRASSNPLLILIGWILAMVAGVWTELARGVGYVARLFGDSARELDPAHRRDGAGLGVLAGAIVTAGAAWWHLGSPLGHPPTAPVRGAFGIGSWTIPILLALLAWRLLRHPDRNAHAGRMVIGWTAFLAGALGIAHIALGS